MSLIRKLTPLHKAYELLSMHIKRIDRTIRLPIRESLGYVLAEDVYAERDIPPFDRAAMDGFAVRYEDTINASPEDPVVLKIVGESDIGRPYEGKINFGEAVYVHTGSKIPEGANAVVPVEYTDVLGDSVYIRKSVSLGENVACRGEDIKAGTLILPRNTVIRPADIAMMKSFGIREITVYDRPKIGVVAIGNELVDRPEDLGPGKILEYSREIVIGFLREWKINYEDLGIIPDDEDKLSDVFDYSRENFDLLVTIGGTSVGKRDLVPKVLSNVGKIIFHGLAVEPSKPVLFGLYQDFPIIGLPGLPVATFVSTITILREAINNMIGSFEKIVFPKITAILSRRVWSKAGMRSFVRVKLHCRDNNVYAEPIMISGAGVLSSVVMADGIVVVPENLEGFEANQVVEVLLIRNKVLDCIKRVVL